MIIKMKYVGPESNIGSWVVENNDIKNIIKPNKIIRYKDIDVDKCPFCNDTQVNKNGVALPGENLVFECNNCKRTFTLSMGVHIEMDEDDYWTYKYKDLELNPSIKREEIEEFSEEKISDEEWKNMKISMSFCSKCGSNKLILSLNNNNGLKVLDISCQECGFESGILLDNSLLV